MSISLRMALCATALAFTTGQAAETAAVPIKLSKDIATVPTGTYPVEPDHTRVVWRISHHGFSGFQSILPKATGSLQYDAAQPDRSRVEITLDMTAATSGIAVFDQRMADPKWDIFKSRQFPTAVFRSTAVKRHDTRQFTVTGDLTFMGVTHPITLEATFNQAGSGMSDPKNYRIGFDATTTLKRHEWGQTAMPTLGDEVQLAIEAEFIQP